MHRLPIGERDALPLDDDRDNARLGENAVETDDEPVELLGLGRRSSDGRDFMLLRKQDRKRETDISDAGYCYFHNKYIPFVYYSISCILYTIWQMHEVLSGYRSSA